jgi:hypothetical protein
MVKNMSKRQRRQPVRVMPQIEITKSPNYFYVNATGIFGGVDPNDARIIFFLDRLEPEMNRDQPGRMRTKEVNRELQVEVHMSPHVYKAMMIWMNKNVEQYEKRFGEIVMGGVSDDEPTQSHIS